MGPIRIAKSGVVAGGLEGCLDDLRRQFEGEHYVRLPELFEPGLLRFIQTEIERGEFYERVHDGIKSNKELCMKQSGAYGALLVFLNDEKLFQMIQSITQCDRIGCFEGRVYRVIPGQGHHDAWHSDMAEDRLVAMSINLSTEVYKGGTLQIRESASEKIISKVPNVGSGDAIIFGLSPHLQHQITEVKGKAPKTAFAGWFRAKPDFLSLLKGVSAPAEALIEIQDQHRQQ
jgi:2OG-Fe(II) oxygenase superfamily